MDIPVFIKPVKVYKDYTILKKVLIPVFSTFFEKQNFFQMLVNK